MTLLSVVLALALTAALAACGSNEPSGVIGPDRTASTPTETPASPARTPSTTGAGDAPTATDAAATAPPAASDSVEADREALVALYNAAHGRQWLGISNYTEDEVKWLSDAPLGEWEGVTTDDDGRVIGLSLSGYRLIGKIPAELGSLSNLEILDLNKNGLSGEIPAELGSLSNLTELYLGNNELSGEIPAELGSLSNLTELYLNKNELSGEIPAELGSLANLEYLSLSVNWLSGEIPAELGSLSNLTHLYLRQNDLSGCVPSSLRDQLGFQRYYRHLSWLLLKPRALSRGLTAYRPEGAPSACWLWRMALPSNGVSASPFVGLPVDGGLTALAHADALDRQTFSQR